MTINTPEGKSPYLFHVKYIYHFIEIACNTLTEVGVRQDVPKPDKQFRILLQNPHLQNISLNESK